MIDIHNHALFGVDDGAKTLPESMAMLKEAKEQGIQALILTPHYRHGMFSYPLEVIEKNFKSLLKEADKLGIDLYLGCEFHVNSKLTAYFEKGRCHTLADTEYILAEYAFSTEYTYIYKETQKQLAAGYIPVIAHVERYECFQKKPQLCQELSNLGALIQINAGNILGIEDKRLKKVCKKILKNHWADVVASDSHDVKRRSNHMQECYRYVEKKYGMSYAKKLFCATPANILGRKV